VGLPFLFYKVTKTESLLSGYRIILSKIRIVKSGNASGQKNLDSFQQRKDLFALNFRSLICTILQRRLNIPWCSAGGFFKIILISKAVHAHLVHGFTARAAKKTFNQKLSPPFFSITNPQ